MTTRNKQNPPTHSTSQNPLGTCVMPTEQDPDSSEDEEYVPPPDDGSDADSDAEKTDSATKPLESSVVDEVELKRARQKLWDGFQDSIAKTPQSTAPSTNMVTIEKRYRFAGEDVVDIVEVAQDSADAKKWPVWKPPVDSSATPQDQPPVEPQTSTPPGVPGPSDPPTNTKPPGKRPGPRKPKISLAVIPNNGQKTKKLTTLDKSAMDWRAHVQAEQDSGVQDELEANRRSGGYLEKTAFLKRVDERKDDVLQAARSSKRRRL
ncbi:bucentaur or craniofacial development-domain-containing protein [Infundibulicybe gibba]|nr:bucentaur or craniofacial development-domain-containing protein [Infundibulicybe gibba]